jgi:hypothetical protein
MIKHRFAKTTVEPIVDIQLLKNSNRHELAPYSCFGCGGELIPKLGEVKIKHFAHKNKDFCSQETYLHKLAKDAFRWRYEKCLAAGKAYKLTLNYPATCDRYEALVGLCRGKNIPKNIDLTKHFKSIYVEKAFRGFVPDIRLSSIKDEENLFVEIAVTHKCEESKIELGERILEISVSSETDIDKILYEELHESSSNISLYNFRKKNIQGDICNGDCEKLVNCFILFKSKKSILLELPIGEAIRKTMSNQVEHSEILGTRYISNIDKYNLYKEKIRESHFSNRPISNCFMCRYHGLDGTKNAIFCKVRKESVGSNEAISCRKYKPFHSMKACQKADEENEEYSHKRRDRYF